MIYKTIPNVKGKSGLKIEPQGLSSENRSYKIEVHVETKKPPVTRITSRLIGRISRLTYDELIELSFVLEDMLKNRRIDYSKIQSSKVRFLVNLEIKRFHGNRAACKKLFGFVNKKIVERNEREFNL